MTEKQGGALSAYQRWTYGFSRFGFTLAVQFIVVYGLIFLTNCLKLDTATAGLVISIGSLFDLLIVLFIPKLLDTLTMPWGKYRSWFLIAPIVSWVCFAVFFSPLMIKVLSSIAAIAIGVVSYTIWMTLENALSICLLATNNYYTNVPIERVRIFKLSTQLSQLGGVGFGFILLPMIYLFGGVNELNIWGFFWVANLYSAFQTINFLMMFKATDGIFPEESFKAARSEGGSKLFDVFATLFREKKLLSIWASAVLAFTGNSIFSMTLSYFFLSVLNSRELLSAYNWLGKAAAFVGATVVVIVSKLFSRKKCFGIGYAFSAVIFVLAFVLSELAVPSIVILIVLAFYQLGTIMSSSVDVSLYGDVTDIVKAESGRDLTSDIMTIKQSVPKFSTYIASMVVSFSLVRINFNANVPPSESTVAGLRIIATVLPAIFLGLGVLLYATTFKLSEEEANAAREKLSGQAQ